VAFLNQDLNGGVAMPGEWFLTFFVLFAVSSAFQLTVCAFTRRSAMDAFVHALACTALLFALAVARGVHVNITDNKSVNVDV
jgi:hypothetical protein